MNSLTDQQLLRDYIERRSETAFAELVRRHVDFVYSAALRMVCDAHLAKDVTQGAFVALAQNARQLAERPVLSGWLHRTAQNLAANAVRSEVRRRAREQEAAAMNELLSAESDVAWEQIAPHLDTALGELNEADRDALLLRYFEKKSAREMAKILGTTEDTTQKRVSRAVEKLREIFSREKIKIGASGLIILISANAVQSAPIGLAVTISATAIAGTAIHTSTLIAATKTIAMTTLQKSIIGAALAAAVGTGIFEARQNSKLQNQIQTLQQQQAPLAEQIQELQSALNDATNQLANLFAEKARLKSNSNENELLKLRGETGVLQQQANELAEQIQNLKTNQLSTSDKFELSKLHYGDAANAVSVAATKYMKDNNGQYPTSFDQLNLSATNFASDVEPKNFEFGNGTNNLDGHSFFFRVQVPIQNPDGNWVWIYGSEQDGHGSTEIFNVSPQSN